MALKSLNQLRLLREIVVARRNDWLKLRYGLKLGNKVSISLSARFAPEAHGDISIGDETLVAFKTLMFTRDLVTGESRPIRIGSHCFVGGGSIIGPGVTMGDESVIGGGSVVLDDVPPRTIVGGNPARVLRRDIEVGPYGRLKGAQTFTDRMYYGLDV